ncbi:response regulator [Candidatus Magnetaquicoccus inordinatus]|uniref:response regulator n=1 Tax=Candidatus Magnetaquicoccus inordinatus TaxID=2496818 RepID=UPI00187D12F9|nr:response regulator [Candidatus Magnetaquicoccus inordinatus]
MESILLVEDDPHLLLLYRRFLQEAGLQVHTAANGQQALHVLQQEPVRLVITDLLMPEGDGFELMRAIHNQYQHLPVIAITGGGRFMSSQFLLESARSLGARMVLHKPFREEELLQSVVALLHELAEPIATSLPESIPVVPADS